MIGSIDSLRQREWRDWARKDLSQYRQAQNDIEHFSEKYFRLREKSLRLSRPLSDDKVQVQASNNGPEELLCVLAEMGEVYRNKQIRAERICREIELRISELSSPQHQRILRDYWLYNQTLKEISVMEMYEYATIKEKHAEALEAYGEKYLPPPTS